MTDEEATRLATRLLKHIGNGLNGVDANTSVRVVSALIVQLTMSLNEALGVEGQERSTADLWERWKGTEPFLGFAPSKPPAARAQS